MGDRVSVDNDWGPPRLEPPPPESSIVTLDDPGVDADDRSGTPDIARFVVGVVGLFVSTTVVALAVIVVAASLVPGLRPTVVTSGSMEPAIRRGDVVLYRAVDDDIGPGTVLVFDDADGHSTVHRAVIIEDDGSIVTRGDANHSVDPVPVPASAVDGEGVVLVPWIGLPRVWWADDDLVSLAAALVLFGFTVFTSRWASDSLYDPWRDGDRVSPARSWLGTPAPVAVEGLAPASAKAAVLARARACD